MFRYQATSTEVEPDALPLSRLSRTRAASDVQPELPPKESDSENRDRERRLSFDFVPVLVIGGQILLVILTTTILVVTTRKGQLPMSKAAVDFFTAEPQVKTFAFTTLATIVSMASSFLFTLAVRHAIVSALTRPITISTLGFGVKISKKIPIWDSKDHKWVVMSVLVFGLGLAQTPAWSALLTPGTITVYVPVSGSEIDLTSAAARSAVADLWDSILSVPFSNVLVIPSLLESGFAAANGAKGLPAEIDFEGYTYNVSSHGIVPVSLTTSAAYAGGSAVYNVSNTSPWPPSTNFSNIPMVINQQGVAPNVSCTLTPFDALDPSVERNGTLVNDLPFDYMIWNISASSSDCGREWQVQSLALSAFNGCQEPYTGYVRLPEDCSFRQPGGAVFDGQGRYSGDYMCNISVPVVNTIANYSGAGLEITSVLTGLPDASSPPVLNHPVYNATGAVVSYAQTFDTNIVGDMLVSVISQQASIGGLDQGPVDQTEFGKTLEVYISGVAQLTGTIVKTLLAEYLFLNGSSVPLNMTRSISGYAVVETLGWQYKTTSSILILIPIFIFGATTIAISLGTQFMLGREAARQYVRFDPSDPLELMAAASAGGMAHVFGTANAELGTEPKIRLGSIGGGHAFLEGEVESH